MHRFTNPFLGGGKLLHFCTWDSSSFQWGFYGSGAPLQTYCKTYLNKLRLCFNFFLHDRSKRQHKSGSLACVQVGPKPRKSCDHVVQMNFCDPPVLWKVSSFFLYSSSSFFSFHPYGFLFLMSSCVISVSFFNIYIEMDVQTRSTAPALKLLQWQYILNIMLPSSGTFKQHVAINDHKGLFSPKPTLTVW